MLPDVPTLDEAGLPGFEDETFNAIIAPAGTPGPVVAKLHDAIADTLNQPQVRERLAQQGIEAKASASPAAFRSYLQAYQQKYQRIAAGIKGK
jgi:tripartite-type tricarboxylate transporter receptor subunit TctC